MALVSPFKVLSLATVHLSLLALMVVGPMVAPNLAREFGSGSLGAKGWTTAMIAGTGLAAFFAGAVSDALGRRLVGVLAALILMVGALFSAISESYWVVLGMAPLLGIFGSVADVNMDGYLGSLGKGREASGVVSRVQMPSDVAVGVLALIFGLLAFQYSESWRWFFVAFALLCGATLLIALSQYPAGTAQRGALRDLGPSLKAEFGFLRLPGFLWVVGAAAFGSATAAAVTTDGPVALSLHVQSSGWVYGGVFGLLALSGAAGFAVGGFLSHRARPAVQMIVGGNVMTVCGVSMVLAQVFLPGNAMALGLPMAASFGGHTIVTGAVLAAAMDIAGTAPGAGASVLTIFKRVGGLGASLLLVAITGFNADFGPIVMSVVVLACALLSLGCSIVCSRLGVGD